MAKKDYVEYDKKEDYKEKLDYLQKFNLTSHNINKFEDKVNSIVSSIDTEIRSSNSYINDLQATIKVMVDKPEMKGMLDDPWYKVYKQQHNLMKYMIRATAFKTWLIKFLITSNNKFSEFLLSLNEDLVDLRSTEIRANMFEKLYEDIKRLDRIEINQNVIGVLNKHESQMNKLTEMIKGGDDKSQELITELRSRIAELEMNLVKLKAENPDLMKDVMTDEQPIIKHEPTPDGEPKGFEGYDYEDNIMEIDTDKKSEYIADEDDDTEAPVPDIDEEDTDDEEGEETPEKNRR